MDLFCGHTAHTKAMSQPKPGAHNQIDCKYYPLKCVLLLNAI